MSTSRQKQQAQGRRSKTKKSGNGTKRPEARKKKMRKGPKHLWFSQGSSKKRRK